MMMTPPFKGFVKTFITICGGVFLLQALAQFGPDSSRAFHSIVVNTFGLVPELFFRGRVFQAFTWIFLHADFMHLLFNMLAFWMFGSMLEQIWGSARMARFVFVTGICTGALVAFWALIDPATYAIPTIGASGIVFAILIAVSRLFPDQVVLAFFIFPMRMRYFAYLMIAIEFYALYSSNRNGVSNIAHLSGALVGLIYMSFIGRGGMGQYSGGSWWRDLKERWHQRRMRKRIRVIHVGQSKRYH